MIRLSQHCALNKLSFPPSFGVCRVICLCAQFEAVLQHGLRKSRGLALTAAAIKHAAGFSSKTEAGTVTNSIKQWPSRPYYLSLIFWPVILINV